MSFSLTKGENLLISGPNGIGKTSFIRLCNGIWKKSSGEIRIPSKTMFVSQKPLITNGTLKSQVVYPNDPDKYTDQEVKGNCFQKIISNTLLVNLSVHLKNRTNKTAF